LFVAIRRFITQLVLSTHQIFTLDVSIFPGSMAMFDDGFLAYMSAATLANRHRNAQVLFWAEAAHDDAKLNYERIGLTHARRVPVLQRAPIELKSGKFLRNRNRWQLALTLLNNPSVIPLRRNNTVRKGTPGYSMQQGRNQRQVAF
jgi:hypothetical protein